jgi:hypothetical protein
MRSTQSKRERADFIIPSCSGQAFCLFLLFGALTEESQ